MLCEREGDESLGSTRECQVPSKEEERECCEREREREREGERERDGDRDCLEDGRGESAFARCLHEHDAVLK